MTVAIPTQQTILDEPIEFGSYQVFVTQQPMLDIRLREDGLGMWNLPVEQVRAYKEAFMALKVAHEAIVATLRTTHQHVPYGVPDTMVPMNDDIDIHSEIALEDALAGVDLTRTDRFRPDEPPLFIDTVIHPVKLCGTHLHFLPNAYPQEFECYATNCGEYDISSGPCTLPIGHEGSCPIDLTGDATEDCTSITAEPTQDPEYGKCVECGTVLEVDDNWGVAPHSRLKTTIVREESFPTEDATPAPRLMKTLREDDTADSWNEWADSVNAGLASHTPPHVCTAGTMFGCPICGAEPTAEYPITRDPEEEAGAEPNPTAPPEPEHVTPNVEPAPVKKDDFPEPGTSREMGEPLPDEEPKAIVIHPLKDEAAAEAAYTVLFNVTHAAYATPWRYTTGLGDPYVNLSMRQVGVQPFIPTWTGEGRLIVEVVEHDGHNSDDARFAGMSRKVMPVVTQIEARLADLTDQEASDIAYPHPAPALATKTAGRTIVKSTKPTTRKNTTK